LDEPVYPNLVKLSYANLTTRDSVLHNRVNGINVRLTCEELASHLDIPSEGLDILNESLHSFEGYLTGYSPEFASEKTSQ